ATPARSGGDEGGGEARDDRRRGATAIRLRGGIEIGQIPREQLHPLWVAFLGRRHRLHDVAGVAWMVVAVVGDEPPASVVGGEEPRCIGREMKAAVAVRGQRVRLEELLLRVELKGPAALVLIGDVRRV